jgi:succinate dehydrogenase / fumarate reductase cytochrome b subunit
MSEAKAAAGERARPISPHVQVWRWHITMATSILHRASGAALYAGALIIAGWAAALACGEEAYGDYLFILGSPVGKLVLFGLTLSAFYHLANGLRHLVWDAGKGFEPKTASTASLVVIAVAIVATAGVWICAFIRGAL